MTKSRIAHRLGEVEEALEDAVRDLRRVADGASEEAGAALARAASSVAHAGSSLAAHARDHSRVIAEQSRVLAQRSARTVREHPRAATASALLVLGIGALAAVLLTRPRD